MDQTSVNATGVKNPLPEKPEKFKGVDFKRWQQKMLFFLTTMNLAHVVKEEAPVVTELPADKDMLSAIDAWTHSEFLCRNYILNGLDDCLYDVYSSCKTAKDLWDSLTKKYITEDAGSKKFIIGKFLKFNMVDSKPVMGQVEELQRLIHDLHAEGCSINEHFQVGAIIEKLPSSWNDFKIYLKHKRREMSLEDLILRLRVEEDHRKGDKADASSMEAKANFVEASNPRPKHFQKNKEKNAKKKNNSTIHAPKAKDFKKIKGACWVCGKPGHRAQDCRFRKDMKSTNSNTNNGKINEANVTEGDMLVGVVSETNMVSDTNDWWIDTGATRHICGDKNLFSTYEPNSSGEKLYMGNASAAEVVGKGRVVLKFTSGKELTLLNVLHVPEIRKNLVSGPLLSNKGLKLVFESDKFVLSKGGMFVGKGYLAEGLFKLNVIVDVSMNNINKASVYSVESIELWHARLGHINYRSMHRMANLGLIPKHAIDFNKKCEICVESKFARQTFKSVLNKSSELLDLIHSDLCDFKSTPTRGGKNYYISFIDDCSKYCYVYLVHSKDEALNMFKTYKAEVENQLNKKIKVLRSDRGGEYESSAFADFCNEHGIVHQTTAPYTPQQNGVAERKNRTLKDMINSMLNSSRLPHNMWGEALLTANKILNQIPHKRTNQSPYELWKGRMPTYKILKVWGCLAKVRVPLPKRTKLGPKTVDCAFIGYANNSAAFRFLVVKSEIVDIHVNTILESIDVEFFEKIFPYKDNKVSSSKKRSHEQIHDDAPPTSDVQVTDLEPRRSTRIKIRKSFGPDFIALLSEAEPENFKEAISSTEAPFWKEAIRSEMESIMQNNTWELVDLPPGNKPIGYKWIFKKKFKPDGSIDKYKARLVAKGYRQREGLDYFDTYSPVSRITSIRMLISIAALYNLEIHQMDVKTAFLNGELEEEIYMEQPEGFIVKGQENKVCKLVKSLYGLKQAPKMWHEKFDHTMITYGFKINESDKCVYVKSYKNSCVIVCLYVDDMLILGTDKDVINSTKKMLNSNFDKKDLGLAYVILGIRIKRIDEGYILTQSHYVESILKKFGHYNDNAAVTPFDPNCKLKKHVGDPVSQLEYARVIGSLMYLMNSTRPDLAYSISRLSRYTSNPGKDHWNALVRVLRYLKGTMNFGLHYSKYPPVLEGYSDANWISDSSETKSTSGYVFTFGGAAVAWKSSKQTCIARSTMESEFIALEMSANEAEWLRNFMEDIPLVSKPVTAICIHCDCMAAIARAKNKMYNGTSRHIRRRHNTIRQLLKNGIISIDYVKSKENIADPLTKGLPREQIKFSSRGMGLKPIQ
ncbi:hypothetical protein ACFX10_025604 [Malus domestica]